MNIFCLYDELLDPKKLIDNDLNRNNHIEDQVERLSKLYKEIGIRHPVIVSKRSGKIVAGHGRKLAAIRAGIKKFPVVYQEFESEEQEYQFIQSDNAIALWSELDLAQISEDVKNFSETFDVELLGIKGFGLSEEIFDLDSELEKAGVSSDGIRDGVKKAIQIEFTLEDYEEAQKIISELRKKGEYVGGLILEHLRGL